MKITNFLSTLAVAVAWVRMAAADTEFEQVRRRTTKDHSNRKFDTALGLDKYFRESPSI